MSTPIVKKETVECILDQEEPPCSDNMYLSEHLLSSEYVNYYDSKDFELKQLKEEFPEDERLQSDCGVISIIVPDFGKVTTLYLLMSVIQYQQSLLWNLQLIASVVAVVPGCSKNNKLIKLIDDQKVKHENTEEGLSLKIKEENDNKKDQVTIKTERLDERDILDNAGASSIHYEILVTAQEVQCKLCDRIFKNGFNLLKHNQEHIKVKIITPAVNVMDEIHQCRCCDTHFDNEDKLLKNISLVHKQKTAKCRKQLKSASNLKPHSQILHKNNKSPKQVRRKSIKCKYCNVYFENRYVLYKHMELCRTGKVDEGIQYKCDSCKRFFTSKATLTLHKKMTHTDYGRMFDCLCGKQFRSPLQLDKHKKRHLDRENQNTNKDKFQCDMCEKFFKRKNLLHNHIKRCHTYYGKVFECWCGEHFPTPVHLGEHKIREHNTKIQNSNKNKFQCDLCHGVFVNKNRLVVHIKRFHYYYGKVFECWCGERFRTPLQLDIHKKEKHVFVHDGFNFTFSS